MDEVRFEWVPSGELQGDRPRKDEPATAVDVVLWSRLEDGRRAVVLVETKLCQDGFTSCNGRESRGNRRRDVCDSVRLSFDNPGACYLRSPDGKRRDRCHWQIFAASRGSVRDAFPGADIDSPCPFAGYAQQPMRNLAIAKRLEQDGTVAAAWFVLCAHDDNPDVQECWNARKDMLPEQEIAPFLPASAAIDAGEEEGCAAWADWMRKRYRLGEVQGQKGSTRHTIECHPVRCKRF